MSNSLSLPGQQISFTIGNMENTKPKKSVLETIGNISILVGLAVFAVPALAVFGIDGPQQVMIKTFGAFGEPGILLAVFMVCAVLTMLLGTVNRILPLLAGFGTGIVLFAGAFDIPYLGAIRTALFRFPPFSQSGPALFSGALAIVTGLFMARSENIKPLPALLGPSIPPIILLLVLTAWSPFTYNEVSRNMDASTFERAMRSISTTLGKTYVNPEVERAVRQVVEEKDKTLQEKEQALKKLSARLERTEADKKALERSLKDSAQLTKELEAAKQALKDLEGRIEKDNAPVKGGRYDLAVQPTNPIVRDFAVKIASAAPGPWDDPQGSKVPNAAGAKQLVLIHGAISSNWKYVSDPAVSWTDYTSPASRTIALGLAGDCDDYATVMASCIIAVGGRARIIHGFRGNQGHAWAEVWLGRGSSADRLLQTVASYSGRSAASLAVSRDTGTDDRWLVLDWELGRYSFSANTVTLAWMSN